MRAFFALLALVKKSRIGTYFTIFDDAKTLILLKLSCNENRNGQYIPKYSAAAHSFFSKKNVNLAAAIWKKKIAKTSTTIFCFPKWKIAPSLL